MSCVPRPPSRADLAAVLRDFALRWEGLLSRAGLGLSSTSVLLYQARARLRRLWDKFSGFAALAHLLSRAATSADWVASASGSSRYRALGLSLYSEAFHVPLCVPRFAFRAPRFARFKRHIYLLISCHASKRKQPTAAASRFSALSYRSFRCRHRCRFSIVAPQGSLDVVAIRAAALQGPTLRVSLSQRRIVCCAFACPHCRCCRRAVIARPLAPPSPSVPLTPARRFDRASAA